MTLDLLDRLFAFYGYVSEIILVMSLNGYEMKPRENMSVLYCLCMIRIYKHVHRNIYI